MNTSEVQIILHLSAAIKLVPQKLFIDKTHEYQVVRSFGKRRSGSVVWRARQLQQFTLPAYTQCLISAHLVPPFDWKYTLAHCLIYGVHYKHLLEKIPISDICEQYELRPTVFYRWQKQFFEQGARTFEVEKNQDRSKAKKILALEQKLQIKNEVLSELMEEHIRLKKNFGGVWTANGLNPI